MNASGTLRRYILFQIPGAALLAIALWYGVEREWVGARVAVLLWIAWIAKDALLYPALRTAYTPDRDDPGSELRGKRGIAREALGPSAREGSVTLGPELWRAVLDENSAPVAAGEPVRICGVHGLQLVVERIRD
jgi:membrane protein implicated in regulation of membrane protease activity